MEEWTETEWVSLTPAGRADLVSLKVKLATGGYAWEARAPGQSGGGWEETLEAAKSKAERYRDVVLLGRK